MSLGHQRSSSQGKNALARWAELHFSGGKLLSTTTNHDQYRVLLSSTLYHQAWPVNLHYGNLIIDEWILGCKGVWVCVCVWVCEDHALWEAENSISHTEERRQAGRCAAGRESAWQSPWMKWQDYRGIRKPAEMDDNAVYGKVSCCWQREIQTVSIIWSRSLKSAPKQI